MEKKENLTFPALTEVKIVEAGFSPITEQTCKMLGATTLAEVLEKMRFLSNRKIFGRNSRREIRRAVLELGIALDQNFQPFMKRV